MYPLRRVERLVLEPAGPNGSYTVELKLDDGVQNLALSVYRPGYDLLGAGQVELFRCDGTQGVTAFVGTSIVVPVFPFVFGADTEIGFIHPANANPVPVAAEYFFDGIAYVKRDKPVPAQPLKTSVTVTNLDAVKKEVILLWTGIIWRNT